MKQENEVKPGKPINCYTVCKECDQMKENNHDARCTAKEKCLFQLRKGEAVC